MLAQRIARPTAFVTALLVIALFPTGDATLTGAAGAGTGGGAVLGADGDAVVVTSDLAFGSALDEYGVNETLRLDLYDPGDTARARPALVLVHGGGFSRGDKAEPVYAATARAFAGRGLVVASVNYRLRADTYPGFPIASVDAQHDVQAAVRWLRAHAAALRLDPDRIAIAGHSAGALTALRVATSPDDPGDSGTPGESSAVSSVLAVSGFLPADVDATGARVLMLHGSADTVIPVSWADDTCRRWRSAGGDCRLVTVAGGTHDATGFFDPGSPLVDDFLTCTVGGRVSFGDVAPGTASSVAVGWATGRGVLNGGATGPFGPAATVTRSQLSSWAWRLVGRPPQPLRDFADLPAATRVARSASWAVSRGVLPARADGSFDPAGTVTRAEGALALWRLAGHGPIAPTEVDVAAHHVIADYAPAVEWLDDRGLDSFLVGGVFRPDAPLRRAQLVRALRRLSFDGGAWADLPDGAALCFPVGP